MSDVADQYQDKFNECVNNMLPEGVALDDFPVSVQELILSDLSEKVISISKMIGVKASGSSDQRDKYRIAGVIDSFLNSKGYGSYTNSRSKGFAWIGNKEAILDIESGLIWSAKIPTNRFDYTSFDFFALRHHEFYNWELPDAESICNFAKKENPLRQGQNYRLLGFDYFATKQGRVDLDNANPKNTSEEKSRFMPMSSKYKDNYIFLIVDCLLTGRKIALSSSDKDDLLSDFGKSINLKGILANFDSFSLPSPPLDERQISDQAYGLWEFWRNDSSDSGGLANQSSSSIGVRPRNPVQDIQSGAVAIDFGTSSTVVAYKDGGRKKLLRIGLSLDDYSADSQPEHYENPTILEFVDLNSLLYPWQSEAYRPRVSWEDVHCSHEALSTQRDNESDPKITASILPKIKQWALRMEDDQRIRIRDRANEQELELPPLEMRNPVKGQPLNVSSKDPLDPIELYAWFLGLAINQRSRGLFLKYYMTFPVAYPRAVKEKILCSFRRGLQRSFPDTLIRQKEFDRFVVEERATEPASFAAAALEHLALEPTDEGVAYGVFDFGGGTTDFDFGLYRLPTEEEEDLGYEQVIEHFGASGDKFLGGENLLENMAYQVFKSNADICRKEGVTFSKPLDADDFPASETLISSSQDALTNTQMLMARLRPFWEKGEKLEQSGIEKLSLISKGKSTQIGLKISYDDLGKYLKNRLREGVEKFMNSMAEAFESAGKQPEKVHVLLAGNASRSTLLQELFDKASNPSLWRAMTLTVSDVIGDFEDQVEAIDCDLEVGEEVEFGEELMLLKIEENIRAVPSPVDGVIKQIFFNSGEELQADSKLLEIALKDEAAEPPGMSSYSFSGFDGSHLVMQVYPPIMNDPSSPYSPNTKTGVALGLLELCPGSSTAIVNHSAKQKGGEAPFNFYVGMIKRRRFQPGLLRHAQFDEWHELGIIREGCFNLVYTQSSLSTKGTLTEDDLELNHKQLDMPSDPGSKAFARAVSSNEIQICSGTSMPESDSTALDNLQCIKL